MTSSVQHHTHTIYRQHAQAIKTRLDCRDLYQHTSGQQPVSRGNWWLFRAPHRTDKHASFGVKAHGFKDFATGQSGDCFALIQLLFDYDYRGAVQWAESYLGISPPTVTATRHFAQTKSVIRDSAARPPSAVWQSHAQAIIERAEQYLWSPDPVARRALAYLRQDRGLTEATIRHFRLGFNPAWTETQHRKADGQRARLAPGIVIPRFTEDAPVKVNVRCIQGGLARALARSDSDGPKYLQLAGSDNTALFIAGSITPDRPVILVEGEFDAMLGQQLAGHLVTFATLGSASTTLTDAEAARLMRASRIFACIDNDAAGVGGLQRLRAALPAIRTLPLPVEWNSRPVKDLTDFVLAGGDLQQIIQTALLTAPPGPLAAVPDTWRTAALHARLGPALMAYEIALAGGLQRFTVNQIQQAAQTQGITLSPQTLRRGLAAGEGVFWQFLPDSDRESLIQKKSPDSLSESGKNATAGRKALMYCLLPLAQAKRALKERLIKRLIEKAFDPGALDAVVPIVDTEMVTTFHYSEAEAADLVAKLYHVLQPIYAQDGARLRAKLKGIERLYRDLAGGLEVMHSTPISPGQWGSREYEARFLRAIVEADRDVSRSRREIAQITGRRASNIGVLLERAGIENRQRPPALVEIQKPAEVVSQAFAISKGRGKLHEVVALRDGQQIAAEVFHPATAQGFAETYVQSGATIAVRIWERAEQVITEDIQMVKRRRRALAGLTDPQTSRPPKSSHPPYSASNSTYTGPGYDPEWVRQTLLNAYLRLCAYRQREVAYDVVANLSGRELVALLLLEYPDTVDDPLLRDLQNEHGGVIGEG